MEKLYIKTEIIILIFIFSLTLATSFNIKEATCPLCKTNVKYLSVSSQLRLFSENYYPLCTGLAANLSPPIIPVCSNCKFVIFKDTLSENEKVKFSSYIKKEEFRNIVSDSASYALLGKLYELDERNPFEIARTYLFAAYQLMDDSIKHLFYLNQVEKYLNQYLQNDIYHDSLLNVGALMYGEVLRLQCKLNNSKHFFDSLYLTKEKYSDYHIQYILHQKELLHNGDCSLMSPIEKCNDTIEEKENQICINLLKNTKGYDLVSKDFEIYYCFKDNIDNQEEVDVSIKSKNTPFPIEILWWNFARRNALKNNCIKLLAIYNSILKKIYANKWLVKWLECDKNRNIEISISKRGTNYYYNKKLLQKYLKLHNVKFVPNYEIRLSRKNDIHKSVLVLFDKNSDNSIIYKCNSVKTEIEHKRKWDSQITGYISEEPINLDIPHWLDSIDIESPSFIYVNKNGEYIKYRNNQINTDVTAY